MERIEGIELERMLEIDERAAIVKAAEGTLTADKKSVTAEKTAITAGSAAVTDTLATLLADRIELVKTIEPRLLATFEQVARGRKGIGIARVVDGLCSACRVRVRPHLYNQIRAGDQILQCESCVRILYWVPEPKAPEGETPSNDGTTPPAEA